MLGWWEKLDKEARARVTLSVLNDRRKPAELDVELTPGQADFIDRVSVRHPRTLLRPRPLRSQRSGADEERHPYAWAESSGES